MSATLQLDFAGFRKAITALQQFTPFNLRTIIRAEAGSILKACAAQTKVATKEQADLRARNEILRRLGYTQASVANDVSINTGVRGMVGRIWQRTKTGKYKLAGRVSDSGRPRWEHKHFSALQWADIKDAVADFAAAIPRAIAAARGAIGLARQSWVQIADDFGTPLESVPGGRISAAGIAKARAAIASSGRAYRNGEAREYSTNRDFVLTMINRLPYGRQIELDAILARNINGRARYAQQNLARGVFDNLARIARAYPGLLVRGHLN